MRSLRFQLNFQKTLFCLILLGLSSMTLCCEMQHSFEHSDCVFYMNYTSNSCYDFNFTECSWVECIQWQYINNETKCVRSERTFHYSWKSCTRHCCDSGVDYAQNYQSLIECQEYLDTQNFIALIIVGSLFGFFIIAFCCKIARDNCQKRNIFNFGHKRFVSNNQGSYGRLNDSAKQNITIKY